MTVAELIKELNKHDNKMEVVCADGYGGSIIINKVEIKTVDTDGDIFTPDINYDNLCVVLI